MYLSYSDEMIGGGGLFMFGFLLLITCWGLFYKKKKLTTSDSLLYHLMIWATAMQLLSYQFSLFSRVIVYFSFAAIVFIPNVICGIENRCLKTFYYSVFWGIQAFFFALYLNNNLSQVLPYSFFKY